MANTDNTYSTPMGVFQGQPDIDFPATPGFKPEQSVPVGGVILDNADITYNAGRRTVTLTVRNTGDRPIQIGSHYHFFEVNRYMEFDREQAFGMHLNIPATTAVRFEPGEEKQVELVSFGGKRRVIGFAGLTDGYSGMQDTPGYYPVKTHALRKAEHYGFKSISEADAEAEFKTPTDKK